MYVAHYSLGLPLFLLVFFFLSLPSSSSSFAFSIKLRIEQRVGIHVPYLCSQVAQHMENNTLSTNEATQSNLAVSF